MSAPKAPRAVSVAVAVRTGAWVGLLQVAATLVTVLAAAQTPGLTMVAVLLYVQFAVGAGMTHYWASGPRFAAAPSGSAGGRRLTGSLGYAAGCGAVLFLLWALVAFTTIEWAPFGLEIAFWYLLCGAVAARTVYRRARSVATPAPGTAVDAPETEKERPVAPEQARAAEGVGPEGGKQRWARKKGAEAGGERAPDPERQARDAERAVTEFGALLSAHPFSPGAAGVTYGELADYSLALDAYERAKSAPAADVPGILADGRAALEQLDRRLGLDTDSSADACCFFDRRHGPGVVSVRWAPPGGTARTVEVCRADAVRLADGDLPGGC
ncbi:hypothetical protein [Streptomyces cyslabdanicus]|uniref:hypothetical protein n=1 Tax=Streptomyces cyslabdanicus TaxID=1470456 RepID=UPI004044DC79